MGVYINTSDSLFNLKKYVKQDVEEKIYVKYYAKAQLCINYIW